MKRYIKSFTTEQLKAKLGDNYPKGGYLYIFKHGIGPGTIPGDVSVVRTKDLPNYYTAVWLDRFLTTSELEQYDIPSETRINELLDRIGYCQKDGDVVPCKVSAATELPQRDIEDSLQDRELVEELNRQGFIHFDRSRKYGIPPRSSIINSIEEAASKTSDPKLLRLILDKFGSVNSRRRIARNPNTPVEILEELSRDTYGLDGGEETRACVARNPNTPYDILVKLSQDDDRCVRANAEKSLEERGVDACTDIKASSIMASSGMRFEFVVKRYGEPADVEVIIADSQEEAENQLNNDGYVDWYEYHIPGKVFDPWETINEDDADIPY